MVNIKETIENKLKEKKASVDTLELWSKIFSSYRDGGVKLLKMEIEEELKSKTKELKKSVKELKGEYDI